MNRREFLHRASSALLAGSLPAPIREALAIAPDVRSGTIADVGHVVILMQENRSFDHYFGMLPGVRGFADRFTVPMPQQRSIWQQRDGDGRWQWPYPLDSRLGNAQGIDCLPHSWHDAQQAWNDGRYGQWATHKTAASMAYYPPSELPFHTALAEAFTICDAYHCSMHGGTNPNRLFLFTGHHDPLGQAGGPVIDNRNETLGPSEHGYRWLSYAERLEAAGVSWKIYQDLDDNFCNNPLVGLHSVRSAVERGDWHSPLLQKGLRTTMPAGSLDALRQDVLAGSLPQVSWLIAPSAYCEHARCSSPAQGAWFTQEVLRALTADPKVWSRTVLLLMYDENDGFFDHQPPPAAPSRRADGRLAGHSTVDDRTERSTDGQVYGPGPRVPLLAISPWSRGGWVNSQVFDHSSVIRFLERRFGVAEPNISAWRRSVCGDLSSVFDFRQAETSLPTTLPAVGGRDEADAIRSRQQRLAAVPSSTDAAPRLSQTRVRRSRALPYRLQIDEDLSDEGLRLRFHNSGEAGAVLQIYDRLRLGELPLRYTIGAGDQCLSEALPYDDDGQYDLWLLGPNGFHRQLRGARSDAALSCGLREMPSAGALLMTLENRSSRAQNLAVRAEAYRHDGPWHFTLAPGEQRVLPWASGRGRWYDYRVSLAGGRYERRYAGRIENGEPSISDPAML